MAYDLSSGRSVKVADEVGDAYHVGVGTDEGKGEISVFLSCAGDPELLLDIAQAIADHPTGREP